MLSLQEMRRVLELDAEIDTLASELWESPGWMKPLHAAARRGGAEPIRSGLGLISNQQRLYEIVGESRALAVKAGLLSEEQAAFRSPLAVLPRYEFPWGVREPAQEIILQEDAHMLRELRDIAREGVSTRGMGIQADEMGLSQAEANRMNSARVLERGMPLDPRRRYHPLGPIPTE